MNPFEFVLAIVLVGMFFKLLQKRMDRRHENETAGESNELRARLAELEERIQVLERIVTDDRADLKREFRDLAN